MLGSGIAWLGEGRLGPAQPGVAKHGFNMPKFRRLSKELNAEKRKQVWLRDEGRCQGPYCVISCALPLNRCHIDHIVPLSSFGTNHNSNLRTLCRRCHVLRLDFKHRGMIAAALRDGIIDCSWRSLTWT